MKTRVIQDDPDEGQPADVDVPPREQGRPALEPEDPTTPDQPAGPAG